jgi:hypothetical protein
MTATTIAGWAVTWDSAPSKPQLPVRCLEDELAPSSVTAQHLAAVEVARAAQKSRTDAERSRIMRRKAIDADRKAQSIRRGGTHE